MKCPNCGLINPDDAQRCDCGYNFDKGIVFARPSQPKGVGAIEGGVVIRDINMPFGSMVLFMTKLGIAAIPAVIIIFFVISILFRLKVDIFIKQ